MTEHLNTAADFIRSLSMDVNNANIRFGNFLDDFYRAGIEERKEMLSDEPGSFDNVRDIDFVNIAATVHKLANDSGFDPPKWVFNRKYYSSEPFFPVDHTELKLIYMFESPTEFKHRNMFVSANSLVRT